MSLPQDTRGKAAGSDYFKAQPGQNKVLLLDDAIEGYQYWTEDGVKRSPEVFEETPGIRVNNGKEEKQQYYWAVPIYDFATQSVMIWQITQKGVRDQLASLQSNDDWGDPTKNYTITLDKSGEGLETKYNVTPNPTTDTNRPELEQIVADYKENPIDLAAQFFGANDAPAEG